jgi:uncharacterized protein (DUF1800 family)
MPEPEPFRGRAAAGHLLRRAAFGAGAGDPEGFADLPYDAAVERLLADLDAPAPEDPPGFDAYAPGAIQQAWLDRMVAGGAALPERLAFLWHGHFATSDAKVQDPALLWAQYRMLRARGGGPFRALLGAVARDVAMIRWLDGNSNRKGRPNENFARELQELFALGIGAYGERDVREAARAFTGWGSRHHDFAYDDALHDHGEKTVHGTTGDLDGDAVLDVLVALPACRRHVARRLLSSLLAPEPAEADVEALADVFARTGGDLRAMVAWVLRSPSFRAAANRRVLVRGPVEVVVAGLRVAGFASCPPWAVAALERMGQILFRPPSVKGWTSGRGWLGTNGVVERLRFARRCADEAPEVSDDRTDALAFDGAAPAAVAAKTGRDRLAAAIACPEFQLS